MVLHVVDGSADEDALDAMIASVEDVLDEIGAGELPIELVLNKIDRVDEVGRRRLANRFPDAPQVSAVTGEGLDELKARIAEQFASRWEHVRLLVPYDEGGRLSELYALGAPIEQREDTPDGVLVVARLPRRELRRFAPYLVADARARESGLIELPIQRLRDDAVLPGAPMRATPGSISRRASASSSPRASAPSSRPGSRSRSPRATPGSCSRAPGSPRSTGSRS